jgi:hypothetical protein
MGPRGKGEEYARQREENCRIFCVIRKISSNFLPGRDISFYSKTNSTVSLHTIHRMS